MIKEKLYWEKYRPDCFVKGTGKIKMFLLPRIEKMVQNGLSVNLLLWGSPGTGKTTLAGILTKDTNCLRINCSLETGIDIVRGKIDQHCTTYGLLAKPGIKTVWLEEFDGTSRQFREGLRGFIEEHSNNVRFVATANSIIKFEKEEAGKAILSRFNVISFDPFNPSEEEFLRTAQVNFLTAVAKLENLSIEKENLIHMVQNNFPDFRSSIQDLQEFSLMGSYDAVLDQKTTNNLELFQFLLNGKNVVQDNFFLVLDNWRDKTDQLLKVLSRPLFKYLLERDPNIITQKGQELIKLSQKYNAEYEQTLDPEIHLIAYVTELKNLLK